MLNSLTVISVRSAFTVHSPRGRRETINRKYYGLSLCSEGRLTYSHKNNTVVSDSEHVVLLPAGEEYTLSSDRAGVFPVINFSCSGKPFDTVISLPTKNTRALLSDFERIRKLLLFNGSRLEIISIFYHMLYTLLEGDFVDEPASGPLAPALKYIYENYAKSDLTNKLLAEKCHISEVYFRRLFLKRYGMSPKQFIIDIRLARAKQLLSEGITKIGTVASDCGFQNQYHFSRLFKEKVGLTPTEYRRANCPFKI